VGRFVLISRIQTFVASAVFALAMATAANAATVTYINADPTPVMELTIDDGGGGNVFNFSFETTVGTADYLALGFNFEGSLDGATIELVSAENASDDDIYPLLALYGDGLEQTGDCEQGCNFYGDGSASLFDYIIKIGLQGGNADNYVKKVEFTISFTEPSEVTLDDFSQFSIRAQSTSNLENSIKTDLTISPVPLPAGLPLLLSGLLAAGWLARRRTV
jgi:hypothetical protein